MNRVETGSWEKVRAKGRDRFLLKNIVRAGLTCGIAAVLIRAALLLFTKKSLQPLWELLAIWAFISVGIGAGIGVWQWGENEKNIPRRW